MLIDEQFMIKITDQKSESGLQNYEQSTFAMLVVSYCINNCNYSIMDVAKASNVSELSIHNWLNAQQFKRKNLSMLIINLDIEPFLDSIISPANNLDRFDAKIIKKYAALRVELAEQKKCLEKVKIENVDPGKILLKKKYFQLFGEKMIDAALNGQPSVHISSVQLIVEFDLYVNDDENIEDPYIQDEIFSNDLDNALLEELKSDGFLVEIESYRLVSTDLYGWSTFDCTLLIDWYDEESLRTDGFSWFLEWLHTPGYYFINDIFNNINQLSAKSIFRLEIELYTVTPEDYDEDGYSELKDDSVSARPDEESLYFEGMEIPVHEAFLREFFSIKGFKFTLKRNARALNKHIAVIDWS